MPIDMSFLKDFRCILTVPKGGLVRQLHEDGSLACELCEILNACKFCIVLLLQIVCLLRQEC
jgi:hypothetical protein